jgi:hypothetical protein
LASIDDAAPNMRRHDVLHKNGSEETSTTVQNQMCIWMCRLLGNR